jgi:ADP-ribose pyrophosphatase YjhB (NUDIX family)
MNDDMVQPYWYIVNVEAAILDQDGRYLMIVRGKEESHAPGVLTLVGGKVESAGNTGEILEATLRREVREEVAVEIHDDIAYLESNAFVADDGDPVVDIVFLCRYAGGTPAIGDPGEVAAVRWMTPAEILAHPLTPPWTRASIERAERVRLAEGW